MARPKEYTDAEILDTAGQVLLEHGVKVATSVIAAQIGLSSAALFHRFGSKRNLIIQALMPRPPKMELVESGPDERAIQDQLAEIGQLIVAHMQAMAPRVAALHSAGVPMEELFKHFEKPPPVVMFQGMTAWFQRAIDLGRVRQASAEHYAMAFLGSLHGRHFFGEVLCIPIATSREDYIQSAACLFTLGCASAQERQGGGQ
jgi:AcrR family transcriptional regulator